MAYLVCCQVEESVIPVTIDGPFVFSKSSKTHFQMCLVICVNLETCCVSRLYWAIIFMHVSLHW